LNQLIVELSGKMNKNLIGKISLGCTVGLSAILCAMVVFGNGRLGAGLARGRVNQAPRTIMRNTFVNGAKRTAPPPPRKTDDPLWLPNTERPAWLDGSLPGDRGFDPLGLSKPAEYLQFEVDQLDQNQAVNRAGRVTTTISFRMHITSKNAKFFIGDWPVPTKH